MTSPSAATASSDRQSMSDSVSRSSSSASAISFPGPVYTVASLPTDIANYEISTYRIVKSPRRGGMHFWSLHLIHLNGSVQLRMVPANDFRGQLQITSTTHDVRPHGRYWDFQSPRFRSVHQVLGLIANRGRESYRFNPGGEGGRNWVYVKRMNCDQD